MNSQKTAPPAGGFAHPTHNVEALEIEHGMSVVDFGSGSGAYVLAIAAELKGKGHVYAVDVQRDLLRRTLNEAHRRGLHNAQVIWGDLEKPGSTKIADGKMDLVLVSNLLFQVKERTAVLEEAQRILKPSGRLVIIDWSDSFGGMGPPRSDIVTQERAVELARGLGFEPLYAFEAGAHHWGVVFGWASKTMT